MRSRKALGIAWIASRQSMRCRSVQAAAAKDGDHACGWKRSSIGVRAMLVVVAAMVETPTPVTTSRIWALE
jgi:hypothetical protein